MRKVSYTYTYIYIYIICIVSTYAFDQLQFDTFIQLEGTINSNSNDTNILECKFQFVLGSKTSTLYLLCSNDPTSRKIYKFKVNQQINQQSCSTHIYTLNPIQNYPQINLSQNTKISAQSKFGISWNFKLIFNIDIDQNTEEYNKMNISIQGSKISNQFAIVYLLVIYYLVSIIVLPFGRVYYQYMYGINFYSVYVSLVLFIAMFGTTVMTFINYVDNIRSLAQQQSHQSLAQPIFMVIILFVCIFIHLIHLYYRLNTFLFPIKIRYKSKRAQIIVIILIILILFVSLYKYYKIHKDVSTYIFFASGLALYMSSFFISKKMNKYYFSFRLVILDSFTILIIGISTRFYPIMYYQIPDLYNIIGVLLIFLVLIIYAVIIFIIINIIKKDANKSHENIKFIQENQLNLSNFEEADPNQKRQSIQLKPWRKMKQQSMVSQLENGSQIIGKEDEQIRAEQVS